MAGQRRSAIRTDARPPYSSGSDRGGGIHELPDAADGSGHNMGGSINFVGSRCRTTETEADGFSIVSLSSPWPNRTAEGLGVKAEQALPAEKQSLGQLAIRVFGVYVAPPQIQVAGNL